jgi:hypothetical protein
MVAVRNSETSVYYETTQCNIPEGYHLHPHPFLAQTQINGLTIKGLMLLAQFLELTEE